MTRLNALRAYVTGLLLLSTCSLALPAGSARGAVHGPSVSRAAGVRYQPYAATSKYLVYGSPSRDGTTLYLLTRHGAVTRIGSVPPEPNVKTQPRLNATLNYPVLLIGNLDSAGQVKEYWFDLKNKRSGSFSTAIDAVAAPDGWIFIDTTTGTGLAHHLMYRKLDGKLIDLGRPKTDGSFYGVHAAGRVVVTDSPSVDVGNGVAQISSLNRPGHYRTFINGVSGDPAICDSMTTKHIACNVQGPGKRGPKNKLFSTAGKLLLTVPGHCVLWPPVVMAGSALAWVEDPEAGNTCHHFHHLVIVGTHRTVFSKKQFSTYATLTGLGGVIVGSPVNAVGPYSSLSLVLPNGESRRLVGKSR